MRRRKADSPTVHNALHLDLNREFEDQSSGGTKYFFLFLSLLALLIFAVSQIVDDGPHLPPIDFS